MHTIMEKQPGVGNVWSVETLRRWLAEKLGRSDVSTLKQYVGYLPESLVRRFVSEDQRSTVVAGYVPMWMRASSGQSLGMWEWH